MSAALTSRVRGVSDELVSDDLWERIAPLLPKPPERRYRCAGRLRVPDCVASAGIVYVLRKGVAWRDVRPGRPPTTPPRAWPPANRKPNCPPRPGPSHHPHPCDG
ncbi:transposase [Streptomyces sp. NBC_01744]|nr:MULTISPECIES: transposase [unclassified Streptomyces]WSC41980.1 transposase [Streptomyces sp. NBC_01763]WSC59168.1 transposase [Streptomyces sp. NBC_01761]WSD29928.1 transposase [Streptomyces sp. NBC_01751]WSF90300.1 transposase [Streptomyces sp. NBC_01744]